jgi:predicted dehydrogenase
MALENGFHVVSDKPLCFTMDEAKELEALVESTGLLFALTHNYTGYPMVKQAKSMIKNGDIGTIRKVVVEYPQGWLATKIEDEGQKQAAWRTDPTKSGASGCIGDIGSHAENLAEYITGLKIKELCADLSTFVEGRLLDDDGNILLRFESGAKGILHASQIAVGEENDLNIRIYGTKGGLQWRQMEPNSLFAKWMDKPTQIFRTGIGELSPEATAHTRIPGGHPEGYLEAFANIYRNVAFCIQAKLKGETPNPLYTDFPTVLDGVRGMEFIKKVVESSQKGAVWVEM